MSQTWTDDTFAGGHAGQVDLQNIENNFACLKSAFSGSSAPSDPVAGMGWLDTDDGIFYRRNNANNTWIAIFNLTTNIAADDTVDTDSLVDLAVTGPKIALLAVDTGQLALLAVETEQIADGAVTNDKLADVINPDAIAGPDTIFTHDAEASTVNGTWTKIKEVTLGIKAAGQLRISFKLAVNHAYNTAHGRIYRDDVAVGTDRTSVSFSGNTFSEDISGWSEGDALQIYAYVDGTYGDQEAFVSDLRFKVTDSTWGTIVL